MICWLFRFATFILIFGIATLSFASGGPENFQRLKVYEICGFRFVAPQPLVVLKSSIRPSTLRTRVDNERYEACPYDVTMLYGQLKIRLDFSRDIVLEQITNFDEDTPVRIAYFRYYREGWHSADKDIELESKDISTLRTPGVLTVSGILTRKNPDTEKVDYCFSVVSVAADKYVTGAVCAVKKGDLDPLGRLFRKELIVSAEKKK